MTTGWINFQLLMEELQREWYIIVTGELELSLPLNSYKRLFKFYDDTRVTRGGGFFRVLETI